MRHFLIEKIKKNKKNIQITGPEAKHITKVLRMKQGDQFILIDRSGSRFQVVIESVGFKEVVVGLEKALPRPLPSPVIIVVCQSLLKASAMDYLIQKTSELGVDIIMPFYSSRTVARYEKHRLDRKMRHWHEITFNSAKQCGRGVPIKIETPISFNEMAEKWRVENALKIILWEEEESRGLHNLLKASADAKKIVSMIGPEGGFSREEIRSAEQAGFVSVSLGNRILRAETATIAIATILQYELGDLSLKDT